MAILLKKLLSLNACLYEYHKIVHLSKRSFLSPLLYFLQRHLILIIIIGFVVRFEVIRVCNEEEGVNGKVNNVALTA